MDNDSLDTVWVLVCTGFAFAMQAGFLCLESGLTRSKNAINVALKKHDRLLSFSTIVLELWFCTDVRYIENRFVGTTHFLLPLGGQGSDLASMFLFQAMFCATAVTIVSGAVAGRLRFAGYIIATLIVSGIIYPVFGHWAGGGAYERSSGWLATRGFVDFAGSTVVHSVGGWAALAAVLVIGPRIGRFKKDQTPKKVPGSNVPMAMLGTMLLWMGWIGFNGGSTLE